ncbi:MAG: MarR family transcriptional regulator [Nevskia sp.]|nr:MarR family transcriptional regulator [Nevskia sp.]
MPANRDFGFLLKDVSRLTSRNFERHAARARLGLSLEQCKVLVHLERNQGINQTQLASMTDIDPMTLVRHLDRMERDGWVERRPDPEDRRAHRLFLTESALPLVKRIWAIADRARRDAFVSLDKSEQTQLLTLLERVRGNLLTAMSTAGTDEPLPARADTR